MTSPLRAIGTWGELDWAYPEGRVARDAVATKTFTWQSEVESALTGESIRIGYHTQHRVPIAKMEDLVFVAAHEQQAIELLERPVRLATEGVAFIQPVIPFVFLHAAVCGSVQAWIDQGGYPDQWKDQLAQALTLGNTEYVQRMQWAKSVGAKAESDPVLAMFGWRIEIKRLEVPLVVVA